MPPEDRHSGLPGGNGSGADVKSGKILSLSDGNATSVTFATPFSSVPSVAVSLDPSYGVDDNTFVTSVTAIGFAVAIFKGHGGAGHTYDVWWIATDAGDP